MNFQTILEHVPFSKEVAIKRTPLSFQKAIQEKKEVGLNPVITEIKPSSPSGRLREVPDPGGIARDMEEAGACGISVLTEGKYFGGSLDNLKKAKEAVGLPVLRKDFIFHPAQIREAYYYGADSVLLITSFFEPEGLEEMIRECRSYGMEPLVEIHSTEDGETAAEAGAEIYVINNRDKDTLEIDLKRSKRLSRGLEGTLIGASGMSTPEDLRYVLKYCDAALIGTAIMKAPDVREAVRRFVHG
jgi:indole-3-glycerol phosphate synthase